MRLEENLAKKLSDSLPNMAGHPEKFIIKICMVKREKNVFDALNNGRRVIDEGVQDRRALSLRIFKFD